MDEETNPALHISMVFQKVVEAKNYSIFKSYMSALVTLFWMPFQWALCVTMAMCQSL